MRLKTNLDYAAYLMLRVLIGLIQMTSLDRCDRACKLLAWVLSDIVPVRRKLIDDNLQLIFPDWVAAKRNTTRRAMWHYLLLMVCEIAHAPLKIHRSNWYRFYNIPDRQLFLKIIMDSRPSIFVTGHFGNFELGGYVTGLFGLSTTSIARPLDNRFVHEYFTQFRSLFGQNFLDKEGSSAEVQELLDRGGTLALLADQFAGNKGCWVDFLGQPTSCHKALALFTLVSGAVMAVTYCRREGRPLHFRLSITGTADPREGGPQLESIESLTRWYNERLEAVIRKNPEQYWWLHDRWREPPHRLRRKLEKSNALPELDKSVA